MFYYIGKKNARIAVRLISENVEHRKRTITAMWLSYLTAIIKLAIYVRRTVNPTRKVVNIVENEIYTSNIDSRQMEAKFFSRKM